MGVLSDCANGCWAAKHSVYYYALCKITAIFWEMLKNIYNIPGCDCTHFNPTVGKAEAGGSLNSRPD